METYFFKMIVCSSLFIGFYYLILEGQKMHRFKRFYLLSSILFSMLIPFISINYGIQKEVSSELVVIENNGQIATPLVVKESIFTLQNIIYGIYALVTSVLLLRFLISLNALRKEIISGYKIKKGKYTVVLQEEKSTAHSFWKYIFLNRKDYEEDRIDEKIIRHEETHLEQNHSVDVLFIEFLLTVFWFNPAFYFYKKAMLTNHEFLADESVLKSETDVKDYQKLLLTELISEKILFTNQFNLRNTKKRIDMMTKKPNYKSKLYSLLTLPLSALLFFVFVEKVPATVSTENQSPVVEERSEQTAENVVKSDDPYEEFQKILNKYSDLLKERKYLEFGKKLTTEDKKRLNELFPQLTAEQKEKSPIVVFDGKGKLEKIPTTDSDLDKYLDSKIYGVWIDGKRVQNSVLKNYKSSDFANVMASLINRNTVDYGKYKYHVSMMTNKYFAEYNSKENIQVGIKKDFIVNDTIKPKRDITQTVKDGFSPPAMEDRKSQLSQNVDKLPVYPGGINQFRTVVANTFDPSKMANLEGTYKIALYFTINEDGSTSNYRAEGDNEDFKQEALRAIKFANSNTKWEPAETAGKKIAYVFKLPLTMHFDKNPIPANYKK